jgi:hypothetical protein
MQSRQLLLAAMSEREFRAHVVQMAEDRGWTVYWTWNSKHSPAGFPDLVLLKGKRMLCIELKTVSGQLDRAGRQQAWLEALGRVTLVESDVWRPTDEDKILAALGPLDPSRLFLQDRPATTAACLPSTPPRARSAITARRLTSTARASTRRSRNGAASKP